MKNKFYLIFLLLTANCSYSVHQPIFRVGDCISQKDLDKWQIKSHKIIEIGRYSYMTMRCSYSVKKCYKDELYSIFFSIQDQYERIKCVDEK